MTYNELCESILTAQEEMLKCEIEANSVTLNGRKYGKLVENFPIGMKPTIFGMAVKVDYALPDDYDFLVQYEPPKPMTNADCIRKMGDIELANFLSGLTNGCVNCPMYYSEEDDECIKHCNSVWQEWVRKEQRRMSE